MAQICRLNLSRLKLQKKPMLKPLSLLNLLIQLESRRYLELIGTFTWINLFLSSPEYPILLCLSPTKRNAISLIGRFYDPLGFPSPIIILFKVLMQELCKSKLSWDQLFEGRTLIKWCSIVDGLIKVPMVKLNM